MTKMTAVLDACVLYPAPLRDVFMWLALADLFQAHWTEEIHQEWMRNVLADRRDLQPEQLMRTRDLMNNRIRGCLVISYEHLIETLTLPDPNDRHVLAAAIHAGAEVIVTFNLSDFPAAVLETEGVRAQHPDDFLLSLWQRDEEAFYQVMERQRLALKNPPKRQAEHLETLRRQQLPQIAAALEANGYGKEP
jgi:predicted nucleic acid-binding protein